ncbi:MAG TPA: M4 family metallopeptidase, partial [Anaerolineales bacterium]|nr:M4 family metallopeptidase [Anaerolineales bacterium]
GLPGTGPVRVEGSGPTGISDVDRAYDYAGNTYDFYFAHHQRDSIDNKGMEIVSTVRFCLTGYTCPFPNAFWNGSQMVYGQGYTSADDVVAHELTHGVTENESALFYYMQSGAISEAFSDIWGELVDQTYNDSFDNDDPSVRWLIGEDMPGSAVRDMSNPLAFGDPDKMTSPNYRCGPNDLGGVHHNNGVANKAAYLMVDGGTFNGFTISGLGITKTIKIWYEVQTNLLTSAADYQDLNSALSLACDNLIGQDGITESDCNQVRKATAAVEMHLHPTECAATDIQKCNSAIASNTFNGSSTGWTPIAGTWGVDANYYYTEGNPDNSFYSTAYTLKSFEDFEFKVRLRRLGDLVLDPSSNGIIIRGQPTPLGGGNRWYSGYGFYYDKAGYFAIFRYDAGNAYTMSGWQQHPAIATGDAWNDLKVLAQGAHLEFYINGILVWSGTDNTYSYGLTGIAMYRKVGSTYDVLQVDWAYTYGGTPLSLLSEDFENPVRGLWYSSATTGANVWHYPQTDNPFAFNATYASSGAYNLWGYNIGSRSDSNITLMNGISLPAAKNAYMTFKHAYSFEGVSTTFYDGGILEYSLNGGPWLDASSLIDFNGYTGIISTDYDNPLAGHSAFVDQSDGLITSRLNLAALAGQSIRFRFRIGTDSAIDDYGWFIDDLDIYICANQAHHAYLPFIGTDNTPISKFHSSFNEIYAPWSAVAGAWTITEQELKGKVTTPERWGSIVYPIQNFSNIVYTVRMKRAGCDACQNQLIIRGNPYPLNGSQNWSSAYSFEYKANGAFSVRKNIAGVDHILKDWTSTSAILKGETWNVLKVVAIGTNLQFYINDILVWSGTDASLTAGQVGIGYYHSTAPWDVMAIDWAQLVDISTLSTEQIARLVPRAQTPPESLPTP